MIIRNEKLFFYISLQLESSQNILTLFTDSSFIKIILFRKYVFLITLILNQKSVNVWKEIEIMVCPWWVTLMKSRNFYFIKRYLMYELQFWNSYLFIYIFFVIQMNISHFVHIAFILSNKVIHLLIGRDANLRSFDLS